MANINTRVAVYVATSFLVVLTFTFDLLSDLFIHDAALRHGWDWTAAMLWIIWCLMSISLWLGRRQ